MRTGEPTFVGIDHVQLAMPPKQEEVAREFYSKLLAMREIAKPTELAKRGGCWFVSGRVQIHLGIEQEFRPARKAHPALTCADYDRLVAGLRKTGMEVVDLRIFRVFDAATFMTLSATGSK